MVTTPARATGRSDRCGPDNLVSVSARRGEVCPVDLSVDLEARGDRTSAIYRALHVTARFADPSVDDTAVVRAAIEVGVAVEALCADTIGPGVPPGLAFGYGAAATDSITPGLRRLARLL
jgi:hypothetical protein